MLADKNLGTNPVANAFPLNSLAYQYF